MDTPASLRFENSFKSLVIPLSPDRHWDQKLFSLSELIPTTLTFLGPGKLTLEETLVPGGCALIQDYIPGRYNLVWETGEGRVYEGFFEIHPHSLSLDEMAGMFAALENKVPGITQNPDFNSGAYQDLGWAGGSDLKMRYLARQSEKIASALAAIQRQPIKALGQSYSLSPKSKRPTAKSQRYGQTHGSSALNYEPVKSLTFDTVENRQLKGMVSYLLGLADGLLQQAMQQQAAIERQLSKTRQEIATLKNNLGLLGAKNFSKTYSDWKGRLELGESEERRLLREGQAHELRYAPLKGLKTQLGLINCAPWFLKVPAPKYGESPRNLWRHRGYSEVYQAYLDLQSKNPGGEGAGASHPTSKLFEFYAFLLCHEMLLASGLSSELPMTAIVAGDSFGYLHPSGARVSLSYDKTVADVAAARQS
ncbi:MAG: hypothetical protein FWF59_11920, partial [Turicibacter sp.]|nr:hypothetical protein [Turicibacter sp.]